VVATVRLRSVNFRITVESEDAVKGIKEFVSLVSSNVILLGH
jgi:hypothetical protein